MGFGSYDESEQRSQDVDAEDAAVLPTRCLTKDILSR